jgi:hypothetical protein
VHEIADYDQVGQSTFEFANRANDIYDRKDTGLTTADATPLVLMASTRRSSTSSTNTGDVSSMSSSSDEGEMEGEISKASLQTYSIPGSLLVAGATPLAITLQHCANAGSVMILAHPIS